MFIRYPYRRDNYYRSRVAPMEIDRDDTPIWAVPVVRKRIIKDGDSNSKDRNTTSKKNLKGKTSQQKIEDNTNTKLIKYTPNKSNSKKNKNEESVEEYNNDPFVESESDYEEDNINTENQMSFEFQHPNELVQPFSYNNNEDYSYAEENNNKFEKKKYEHMKNSSFLQLLLSYSKFFFNVLLLVVALWILFNFIKTVKNDINLKYKDHLMDNMKQISECYERYEINKCSSDIKIPALEDTCRDWEACMSQNPDDIRVVMIGAEVVSEILNRFIEPLSIKSTVVIIVLCTIFFIIIWRMSSIPTNKQEQKSLQEEENNIFNKDDIPIGMYPPSTMDSRFIRNGVMYQIAPAAIYPGEPPYSVPIAYPHVYQINSMPYPIYPVYQQEFGMACSSHSKINQRKSQNKPQSRNKNYIFVKSNNNMNCNRNPYQSKFKINHPFNKNNKNNLREKVYYRVEDNDNDSNYEMIDDEDDNYYDEEYEY